MEPVYERKLKMTVPFAAAAVFAALAAPAPAMYSSAPVPHAPGRPALPVVIDAGHGGEDLGAVVKGVREKDIALVVALKLKARLKDLPVLLTRDNDRYVPLDKRVVDSVDGNGAVFVSIHLNAVRSAKASGATVYSYGPERGRGRPRPRRHPSVPPMPAPPRIAASESEFLARSMAKSLRAAGVDVESAKSDYYVLKNPAQPSVLVELGFLSNPEEAVKLAGAAYQNLLVDCLAKAIEEYASNL
ncbi:MAG: hypothetical protein A2V88_13825 [Elusimicrobia bacterium RBG_16_66_12]|nr:MAG: hypothetical protein A2V88_13825 [Elusimicrobia bacterium RBG_16_66_12]